MKDTEQLVRAGKAHATAARYAEAERCFREALAADPADVRALNGLGVALHELGRLAEARRVLAEAIERAPGESNAHFNLGRVHLELDELDLALACFEEVLCRVHSDADTFAAIATALERRGDFAEAEEYFAEAARFSDRYRVTGMLRFSAGFLAGIAADAPPERLPAVLLQSHRASSPEAVALVACDTAYLRKYGPALATSFASHGSGGMLLHLHVLDPDAGVETDARALLGRAGVTRYCVTTEHGERHAPGSRARAVWYTCARFLHLDAWLRAYDAPIVTLDADAALQAPLTRVIDAAGEGDVGLYRREPRRAPWLDVLAGVLVARPTGAAREYVRLVASYADHFLRRDDPQWHLDQCALYCTLRMLEAQERAPDARRITAAVEAAFYHVGHSYDERMADARYARYVPAP